MTPASRSTSGSTRRGRAIKVPASPPGNSRSTASRTPSSSTTPPVMSMREGLVDLCIVGTDRTTAGGDVANKIGTYTKALAARDNDIPFYVALPSPTIDWEIESGAAIPIERRDSREVTHVEGWTEDGRRVAVRLTPAGSPAANYAFDVTPARLVTGLITERGICSASRHGLLELFPERRR